MWIFHDIQMATYFGTGWCYSHMVGYAGSPTYTVYVDINLTRFKVKVKVTGLLNFRQLAKPCMLAAMTAASLRGFLVLDFTWWSSVFSVWLYSACKNNVDISSMFRNNIRPIKEQNVRSLSVRLDMELHECQVINVLQRVRSNAHHMLC